MTSDDTSDAQKRWKLEELKLAADDYRYRDQLMVTEFALTMTAVALAGNLAVRLSDELFRIIVVIITWIFLVLVSYHLTRINQDRLVAGAKKTQLQKLFQMEVVHQGYAKKRRIKTSAPKLMVWFSYSICGFVLLIALVLLGQL